MYSLITSSAFFYLTFATAVLGQNIDSTPTSEIIERATLATPCVCTDYSQIAPAIQACSSITLSNIHAPVSSTISLMQLKPGTTITFAGTTTFGITENSQFRPIQISGSNVTIKGEKGCVIDGGGPDYWDGLGSNGGLPKPGQFMKIQLTNHSTIEDLKIINYPSHGINLAGMHDSVVRRVIIDNRLGDAPNSISNGLSAAHNSDGFNVGNSVNLRLEDCQVWDQDDCVVVSDSENITVNNFYCSGSHGLSIAGGGTGVGHNITNILFQNSIVTNSTIGVRIKTDQGATGSVVNATWSNITLSNIKKIGLDIQQDYGNSGSDGKPTNGVRVAGITFKDVVGSVVSQARNYYILCGDGSCSGFNFNNVKITGGKGDSCNYPPSGCPK
ncbi:hypothetical protein HYALB_00000442 [Hymenoscyphus albidus]|uniref:endo-polygalacturonase n=1 Tax=Hymenoscyphus albidus TaxID=595503 RepID=A0A9N9LIX7_9HELO|nr:hypothetical protein HYALB_00000442 [Hymenoscyphus albidus]